ncbi:MAG: TRAM domain-containing protein, partial [bacterium]|nr:TRAM domain-containing protein [bacterium]
IFATNMGIMHKLKERVKDVTITTDIIVGFPNETEEQFNDTLSLVEECKFDLAYTFIFSRREGTPAYKMSDNVTLEEKHERLQKLNEIINKYALINNKKLINKTLKVLVEGVSEKDKNLLMGYTEGNKLVNFTGPKSIVGQIVNVKITDAKTWSLDGEYVE